MKRERWTQVEDAVVVRLANNGGVDAIALELKHRTYADITNRVARLKKNGTISPKGHLQQMAETYAKLQPLDPESCQPDPRDNAIVVRRGVGQWRAEIPRVRWVFDLGVANAST